MSLSFEERRKVITQVLNRDEKVQVQSLANELRVSGETIRRDLDRLEKDGMLKKVYGGAIKEKKSLELPFDKKTAINAEGKRAICRAAAELIEDGDSILIGHGTTAVDIVRYIGDKRDITMITASIPAFLLATECFKGKLFFIGGEYEADQKFTSGPISDLVLQELRVNKAFVAAGGLSMKDGISDYDIHGASSSRQLMNRADEAIVLADHTKFGKTTFAHISNFSEVSKLITDRECSEEWKAVLAEKDVELIVANPADY